MGSEAALARQSYDFPHYALFSTDLLREYFRSQRLGVFDGRDGSGDGDSVVFENAITQVRPPTPEEMRDSERKLLFHVRPELHAERNMFELGLLALAQARDEGTLDGWVLNGIGPSSRARSVTATGCGSRSSSVRIRASTRTFCADTPSGSR